MGSLALIIIILETLTNAQKEIVKEGLRTFKFGNGNKLNSLYKVTLPLVIADITVSIITDVLEADIPLFLSKDCMKRARTLRMTPLRCLKRKFH